MIQRPLLANGKIERILDIIVSTCRLEKAVLFDINSRISFGSDSSQCDSSVYSLMQDMLEVVIDICSIYGKGADSSGTDIKTNCNISLSNGEIIYMRLVDKFLALVCVIKSENFDKTFLLNYNIDQFKNALKNIVAISV